MSSNFFGSRFFGSRFLCGGFLSSSFFGSSFFGSGFLSSGFLSSGFLSSGFLSSGFLSSSFFGSSFLSSDFFARVLLSWCDQLSDLLSNFGLFDRGGLLVVSYRFDADRIGDGLRVLGEQQFDGGIQRGSFEDVSVVQCGGRFVVRWEILVLVVFRLHRFRHRDSMKGSDPAGYEWNEAGISCRNGVGLDASDTASP